MRRIALVTLSLAAALASPRAVKPQEAPADSEMQRGPRFLLASTSKAPPVRVDVKRTPVLSRRITLDLRDARLEDALAMVAKQAGLKLSYSSALVPLDHRVRLVAQNISVAGAISELLLDVDVDVMFTASGQAVLVRRAPTDGRFAGTISGRVLDAVSGQPVSSVEIRVAGTPLGTTTTDAGTYVLRLVPAGEQSVTARRIGYRTQTRTVTVLDGGTVTLDFSLTAVATTLREVVSTATGGQRRIELGHTVGLVDADSLVREMPVTNLSDLLTARVPGVMVNFQSGLTGVTSPIRIRGLNSFTMSNDPLVIIDGIRVEATTSVNPFDQYGVKSSRLGDINPDEIESIQIVKGPSAATLYGTDAANGVVVIRTKRGTAGPAQWNSYAEGGVIQAPNTNFPTAHYGFGRTPAGAQVGCTLSLQASGGCTLDSIRTYNPVDNDDLSPLGRGNRAQFGTQVSGGAVALRYFAAAEVESELGFIKMPELDERLVSAQRAGASIPIEQRRPNALRKISLRGNVSTMLGERADLAFSNSLLLGNFRTPNAGTVYQGTVFSTGARTGIPTQPSGIANSFQRRSEDDVTRYISSAAHNWRPADWLTTRSTLGLDFSRARSDQLVKAGEGGSATGARSLSENLIGQYTADFGASATRGLPASLTSRTSVGLQYNRRSQEVTTTSASGLAPGSETVVGAATITGTESKADAVVAGAYVEQQVDWRDRVFATVALRADGSSTFGRNLRTTTYPKAGLSWIVAQDSAASRIPGIGSLRLRAAYGASGVQPPSTAAIATVALSSAIINNVAVNAVTTATPGNPDVKPERTVELEGGVDAEALGGRLRTEVTLYSRKSSDALLSLAFPVSAGGGSRFVNIGSVTNKGLELLINADIARWRGMTFDLSLNGSTNTNKLVRRDPASDALTPNPSILATTLVTGYPLYGLWQKPILGFSDADSDGFIEPGEVQVGTTAVYLGPATPTKQLSVIPTLTLFNGVVRVTSLFDWRGGYKRMHFGEFGRCTIILSCPAVYDPKTPLAEQAKIVANNTATTTAGYIYDGSFTKLRELSVTIAAPQRISRAMRTSGVSLTLSGRNLALWSKYPEDPEVNGTFGNGLFGGESIQTQNTMPAGRYWIARINLSH